MSDRPNTIEVRYSCPKCRLVDARVRIAVRGPDQDVVAWMDTVVLPGLGWDHAARRPWCHPERLADVKIPLPKDDAGRIGDGDVRR